MEWAIVLGAFFGAGLATGWVWRGRRDRLFLERAIEIETEADDRIRLFLESGTDERYD